MRLYREGSYYLVKHSGTKRNGYRRRISLYREGKVAPIASFEDVPTAIQACIERARR